LTPTLINKAQRMYDSRQLTMSEIAASCAVTPTTIYRNIRTDNDRPSHPSLRHAAEQAFNA
jgi:hypothetical protein